MFIVYTAASVNGFVVVSAWATQAHTQKPQQKKKRKKKEAQSKENFQHVLKQQTIRHQEKIWKINQKMAKEILVGRKRCSFWQQGYLYTKKC